MKDPKIDRRNFLKTTAVGAAGLSLLANSTAAEEIALPLPDSVSLRRIIPLNHGWLFSESSSSAAMQASFNDKRGCA
jgi:hypothetical protein